MIEYILPWPPTLNKIYTPFGNRIILSEIGRRYVIALSNALPTGKVNTLTGRLSLKLILHPPLRLSGNKWDICNREKVFCDALTKCGVYKDDSQIDEINIIRGNYLESAPNGAVHLFIVEFQKKLKTPVPK